MLENTKNKKLQLGKQTTYKFEYDKSLLCPIEREIARKKSNIDSSIFKGYDIWNCYEVSWLDEKGKPEIRILRIIYPASSRYIIESKSLKLYLNSFNMTKFKNDKDVKNRIKTDLDEALNTKTKITFFKKLKYAFKLLKIKKKQLIDNIDIKAETYSPTLALCKILKGNKSEYEMFSHLLKTNCPVTGQPDWATIHIKFVSDKYVTKDSLLRYIISYRNAQDFHEACCEKIFTNIYHLLNPKKLYVKCYYTRRGGIDINPVRFIGYNPKKSEDLFKVFRQ